ncbi:hypothetical protein KAX02_06355 [candidate division WOR-3 bacterium]|nr:hypothetical protein [candidate division WOR-3 bacterium]
MSEEIKNWKFKELGIPEEDFHKLPADEMFTRLKDLEDVVSVEFTEEKEIVSATLSRYYEVRDLSAEAGEKLEKAESKFSRVETAEDRYKRDVHEQRVCIGRIGAYTVWYRRAEKALDTARMRHYSIKIGVERERLPELKHHVAQARDVLSTLPRIWTIRRKVNELWKLVKHYKERIHALHVSHDSAKERRRELGELLTEIKKEIAELEVIPVVIRHKYREVEFEIHKSLEYSKIKAHADVNVEMWISGTFKTLLPTKYTEDECFWYAEIERGFRNVVCNVMDDCYLEYGMPHPEDTEERCNIVGSRVTKKTVIDVTKRYEELKAPLTDKKVSSALLKELWEHSSFTITSFTFLKEDSLRDTPTVASSRRTDPEHVIGNCIDSRTEEMLEDVITWTEEEEHEALKKNLTGGD